MKEWAFTWNVFIWISLRKAWLFLCNVIYAPNSLHVCSTYLAWYWSNCVFYFRLWGENFFNPKTKKWSKQKEDDNKRSFCMYVLDPIYKVSFIEMTKNVTITPLIPYGAVNRNKVSIRHSPFFFIFPSYSLHISAPTGHPQVRYTIISHLRMPRRGQNM
jgi:hypothetical protein